jgi:hypothetical protein
MLAITALAPQAVAKAPASTKLIDCRPQSCLLISGYRDDPASAVRINGHDVPVEGARRWHMRLPIETLRAWSPPLARTLAITIVDAHGTQSNRQADLPIGLLGHADLALLTMGQR